MDLISGITYLKNIPEDRKGRNAVKPVRAKNDKREETPEKPDETPLPSGHKVDTTA